MGASLRPFRGAPRTAAQVVTKGEENMDELNAQLTALGDRLSTDAARSEQVANDQRTTLGDANYYEGRAAGLAEAVAYVRELRESLSDDLLVVVSSYVTPSNVPQEAAKRTFGETMALLGQENGRNGS